MNHYISILLSLWDPLGWTLLGLGVLGCIWVFSRWWFVERESPLSLLNDRFDLITRWLLQRRRHPKTLHLSLALIAFGFLLGEALRHSEVLGWAYENPKGFLWIHGAVLPLVGLVWYLWDRTPNFVKAGEGRADAQFRDVPEEWGQRFVDGRKTITDPRPTAELVVYRQPTKLARRIVGDDQHFKGNLTLLSFRWDILCRHIFVLGQQGSGKTESIYAPIMHSSLVTWVYQDSKAELPFQQQFSGRPVWGLDIRGHQTRSGVWNPMEEIRNSEDFDLLVDYIFPVNPRDANPWVRDMARVIFRAVLKSKRWESIQAISRTLCQTRLEPFLERLDPIFRDTMKEPKSQVPILQDLVVTLSRWDTARVRAITEGKSTVTLDDYLRTGGYVMNCEESDALKVPVHVFWAMLLGRLRNRPQGLAKTLLLLDEFGDCGRIPNVQRALVLLRSKGVAIVAGIQNLGLLKDVYPQEWEAVMKGFGTKIWLAANLEDELRLRLSQALGKFTRRVPRASKEGKETEKEADLMPLDAWGKWSELRVALGRLHNFTYWIPVRIPIPDTPIGAPLPGGDPWANSDEEAQAAARDALKAVNLPEWHLQVPEVMPDSNPAQEASSNLEKSSKSGIEEDWL